MRYRVWHKTTYRYDGYVSLSHNQVRLNPRGLNFQRIITTETTVDPLPRVRRLWADAFGNTAEFFSIEHPHEMMSVTATSIVERSLPWTPQDSRAWRTIVEDASKPRNSLDRLASQFQFDSRYAYRSAGAMEYARESLQKHTSLMDAVTHLNERIYRDFEYRSASTSIDTPLHDLLKQRQGVCQDFAHLMIACLRCFNVPARYVSGYILTHPAPGQTKLVGSDASHAWVSVYTGNGDWIDFDPTNNLMVADEHITLAWGRDFGDVSPVQGILVGGGAAKLSVNVDVSTIKPPPVS